MAENIEIEGLSDAELAAEGGDGHIVFTGANGGVRCPRDGRDGLSDDPLISLRLRRAS